MILDYQPQAKESGKRFKVTSVEGTELEDLLEWVGSTIAETLPAQMKVMSDQARGVGGVGTGIVLLMCVSKEYGLGSLVVPFGIGGPWVENEDPPPKGWKIPMMCELNQD